MTTVTKVQVPATVGPVELKLGVCYVYDAELDGDENLQIGQRVEILDGAGRQFAAEIVERESRRWRLRLGA
ncbi:MAG: hypothetical protein ACP5PB_06275 [Acidimicrobiales bacterium]